MAYLRLHQTGLQIEEHYTDSLRVYETTIFAFCHLLGFRFDASIVPVDLSDHRMFNVSEKPASVRFQVTKNRCIKAGTHSCCGHIVGGREECFRRTEPHAHDSSLRSGRITVNPSLSCVWKSLRAIPGRITCLWLCERSAALSGPYLRWSGCKIRNLRRRV